ASHTGLERQPRTPSATTGSHSSTPASTGTSCHRMPAGTHRNGSGNGPQRVSTHIHIAGTISPPSRRHPRTLTMKITRLKTWQVPPRWLFLKIETDEGVYGWGEPVIEGRAATVEAAVHELADYLVGQ